jgi:competence protein ComEC
VWLLVPLGATAGALAGHPVSMAVVVLAAAGTLAAGVARSTGRRPMGSTRGWIVASVVVGLAASWGASRAWSGLNEPLPRHVSGRVTLTGDPRPVTRGVRVEVRAGGRLFDLYARGTAAGAVSGLRSGESVVVDGAVHARAPEDRWRAARHVAGTIEATSTRQPQGASGYAALANAVHRTLATGLANVGDAQRGVLLGVSVGDRGALPPMVTEDLRAAGVAHLTAVSGQHVAIVLALTGPVLARLRRRWRVAATSTVLVGFAVLTRGEPSVLRAVVMAVVVELARRSGGRVAGVRALATAVTILVLIDPLIVWSVGFQLSVAASAGIAIGATRLAGALRGPRPVVQVLAVGCCAQLAVAPLLASQIGPVPVHGVLATALVAPAVAALLSWGLTGGLLAGLAAGAGHQTLANWLHLPTSVLASWVLAVAGWFARLPVGHADGWRVVAALLAVGTAVAVRTRRVEVALLRSQAAAVVGIRRISILVVVMALVVAVWPPPDPASGPVELATGADLHVGEGRDAPVLVIDGRAEPAAVVGALRRRGVRRVSTLVVRTTSSSASRTASELISRLRPHRVVTPAGPAAVPLPSTPQLSPQGSPLQVAAPVPPGSPVALDVGSGMTVRDLGGRLHVDMVAGSPATGG